MAESMQEDIITLIDEDGEEHRFSLIDVLEVDSNSYAVLAPEDDNEEGDAFIFRIESIDGEDELIAVEDDEEFERVAAAWTEMEDEDFEETED